MSVEHEGMNPYQSNPGAMREALADPAINANEHDLYFPRLKTLLPAQGLPFSSNRVKRVLDYGCGPGNFTYKLADMYPTATVLGVDASEGMLPEESERRRVSFQRWDGTEPLNEEPFNVIVAKMVLHYLSPAGLGTIMPNISSLLTPQGSLVVSVPHSVDSQRFTPEAGYDGSSVRIMRQVGKTGINAAMWHREHWLASTLRLMPDDYVAIRDEVRSPDGAQKRLNFLFTPRGERVIAAFRKLRKLGLLGESPEAAAEISTILSDELRAAADYFAKQGNL